MKKLTTKSLVSAVAALFMGTLIMSGCGTTEEDPAPEPEKKTEGTEGGSDAPADDNK